MQKKYPNDEDVLYELMYDLFAVDKTGNSEEIICIANKLLKSDSLETRYGAIQMLAFTYSNLGNDEKAVEYAAGVFLPAGLLLWLPQWHYARTDRRPP